MNRQVGSGSVMTRQVGSGSRSEINIFRSATLGSRDLCVPVVDVKKVEPFSVRKCVSGSGIQSNILQLHGYYNIGNIAQFFCIISYYFGQKFTYCT